MKKIIALVLTLVLCLSVLAACGKSNPELKELEDALNNLSDALDTAVNTDSDTDDVSNDTEGGNDAVPADAYGVGDTAEYDNQAITLVSVEDWTGWDEFYGPEEGNKVIRAYFTFVNNDDTEEYISSFDFECSADGNDAAQYYFGDDDVISATAEANGGTAEGALYFEVPEDAETIAITYEFSLFEDSTVTFVIK